MGELGLLGLTFPTEYGGSGMDSLAAVILSEELARSGFGGVASSVTVQTDFSASHLVRVGNAAQRARFLPDVIAGKRVCALGITEPGAKGFSLFVVERNSPGFSNGTKFEKAGWHCSDTGELVFDDCPVPADNLIGEEGQGFYHALAGLEHERLCLAAQAGAMAELAMERTLAWLRERPGYGRKLWELQSLRHELARFSSELTAAKSLLYLTAAKTSRGEDIKIEA